MMNSSFILPIDSFIIKNNVSFDEYLNEGLNHEKNPFKN